MASSARARAVRKKRRTIPVTIGMLCAASALKTSNADVDCRPLASRVPALIAAAIWTAMLRKPTMILGWWRRRRR
jgi:hypothetical protein